MRNELTLRTPKTSDLEELMIWENDLKKSNHTDFPMFYTRDQMITYLNSNHDIFLQNQQRWIIQLDDVLIGCVDLYDFDMVNSRAGIGIYIVPEYRGKGWAREALMSIKKTASEKYFIHHLFADILSSNKSSIQLFEHVGFIKNGVKKAWIREQEDFVDVFFYQCFLESDSD